MKKLYINPEMIVVKIESLTMLAASPGAGDQLNPGLSKELFDFEDIGNEQLDQILMNM